MDFASTVLLADMWDTNGHMGGGWWVVMMLWMVFFWGAVIFGIVWLVRGGESSQSWRSDRRDTPLETLDRRFAEGDISVDEYHQRRETLAGSSSGQPQRTTRAGAPVGRRRQEEAQQRLAVGAADNGRVRDDDVE